MYTLIASDKARTLDNCPRFYTTIVILEVLYISRKIVIKRLVGFGLVCAPVHCAHPSFWLINTPHGALRALPPPIAASLLLIKPQK
jgi:hypothetical protein